MYQFVSTASAFALVVFWLISAVAFLRLCRRVGLVAGSLELAKIPWVKQAIESEPDAECRKQLRRFLVGLFGVFVSALPLVLYDMWLVG